MPRLIFALGLIGLVGCASNQHYASQSTKQNQPLLAASQDSSGAGISCSDQSKLARKRVPVAPAVTEQPVSQCEFSDTQRVAEQTNPQAESAGTLTIDGRQYELTLIESESPQASQHALVHSLAAFEPDGEIPPPTRGVAPTEYSGQIDAVVIDDLIDAQSLDVADERVVDLNLPSTLALVGGQHPAVGLARWRVQEAYAQLAKADALWLPSIQAGFHFNRHDGNYQASDGSIIDVDRNSFQYGFGNGATGAGTMQPRPGIVSQFHLADAIFLPKIAEKAAWARGHAAEATLNERLLNAASAYIALLEAHQDATIMEETRDRTSELSKITRDFAEAGQGLQADADRMKTELILVDNRLIAARERISVASARLAQAISLDAANRILPMDVTALPLDLITADSDKASLIGTGLATRPELKESQALVAAACEAYKREKYAPFVPSVLLSFSTGGFGGGIGPDINNVDSRYDFDALVTWKVRNLGLGECAARRETCARIQQAKFEKIQVMDQVALEISEAYSQVQFRQQQITTTKQAIQSAENSYKRNLERIRDGQGLPIEVLQSVHALDAARRAYLNAVITYNQAQFRLQWALGWPVCAPANPDPTL